MHVCRFNGTAAEPLKTYIVSALRLAFYSMPEPPPRFELRLTDYKSARLPLADSGVALGGIEPAISALKGPYTNLYTKVPYFIYYTNKHKDIFLHRSTLMNRPIHLWLFLFHRHENDHPHQTN